MKIHGFLLHLGLIIVFKGQQHLSQQVLAELVEFCSVNVLGAITGAVFVKIINLLSLGSLIPANFVLVGMAGAWGMMSAPLTAIFLIAEITGGCVVYSFNYHIRLAHLTARLWNHILFIQNLADRGELITHDRDKTALTLLKVKSFETQFITLRPEQKLRDVVSAISKSNRNFSCC